MHYKNCVFVLVAGKSLERAILTQIDMHKKIKKIMDGN